MCLWNLLPYSLHAKTYKDYKVCNASNISYFILNEISWAMKEHLSINIDAKQRVKLPEQPLSVYICLKLRPLGFGHYCLFIINVENLLETCTWDVPRCTLDLCCTFAMVYLQFIRHFSLIQTLHMTHVDSIGFSVQPLAPHNADLKVIGWCRGLLGWRVGFPSRLYDVQCWWWRLPMRHRQWHGFEISWLKRLIHFPKMYPPTWFTHLHAIPNLYAFLLYTKWRLFD